MQRPTRSLLALGLVVGSVAVSSLAAVLVAQEPSEAAPTWRQRARQEPIQCAEQQPQPFLIRANWQTKRWMEREEIQARRAIHQRAIRYRTENYGYFEGFGRREWNRQTPMQQVVALRLFDRPVRLHRRIAAAARCAEQQIARTCEDDYAPRRLSGIRDRNTYHNGEVSNHVYGIAIDLDPRQNTCCNCVKEWRLHPLCKNTPRSIFERMVMPECWVRAFERYGFYWLGHDRLMDTMHFEFLGDADRIAVREESEETAASEE